MDDSRSRRSVASLGDLQKESSLEDQPPDITPIGGVPNLKGKVLVRPIAFRPSPGRPGSSTGPQVPARPGSSTGPSPGPFISRPNSQGFAPGHPLVKDGPRPFGSSQELSRNHPQSLTSSLLSKFSSLDRRSVQQRSCRGTLPQGGNRVPSGAQSSQPIQTNGLRLSAYNGYDAGSSTSLPPVGISSPSLPNTSQEPNRGVKEPERRHSLYDSNSRGQYPTRGTSTPSTPASINVNGLPDPNLVQGSSTWAPGTLNGSRTSLDPRSSVEPRNMEPRTRHSGAGTPQFRNLAGLQFQTNSSRSSLSNLTSQIVYSLQRSTSGNNINETQNSLHHHIDSPFKGSTATIDQDYNSTPSPSDSAVGDLETVLKEKDNEIVFLRETMEQNEQVIFKVYEEKERVWEREIRKIKALYDSRFKANQQKAGKMEQALMNQTLQAQNEARRLEQELEAVNEARANQINETRKLEAELSSLRKSLEEMEWTTFDKSQDSSSQGSQISSFKPRTGNQDSASLILEVSEVKRLLEARNTQVSELKSANKSLTSDIINLKNLLDLEGEGCTLQEISQQKEIIIERDKTIEKIQNRLRECEKEKGELRTELDLFKENFEVEKVNWLDEKEKVIRYQKQLQLNYVQMYKKNKSLESEVDQLKKALAETSSNKTSSSTRSRLFSKFSKFHESQGIH